MIGDDKVSDGGYAEEIQAITDPRAFLRRLVQDEDFLGYDPYFSKLRGVLLAHAKKLGEQMPSIPTKVK